MKTASTEREAAKPMTHEEAVEAIVSCAQTVSLLSYREAIEGYLKMRGLRP